MCINVNIYVTVITTYVICFEPPEGATDVANVLAMDVVVFCAARIDILEV